MSVASKYSDLPLEETFIYTEEVFLSLGLEKERI